MKKNIAHKGKKQFVEEFIEMMDRKFGDNWNGQSECPNCNCIAKIVNGNCGKCGVPR